MISIERSNRPSCLSATPSTGHAYRRRDVVSALWTMQRQKCCYSEMLIPKHGHGKAVEHFRPQATFGWLRNEWTNLLLACPQCNGKKSDHFPLMVMQTEDESVVHVTSRPPGVPAIIDPSDPNIDPEQHVTYVLDDTDPLYGQIIPRDESDLGRQTIEVTGIDDEFFLRLRKGRVLEVFDFIYLNILIAVKDGNDPGRDAALATFELYMSPTGEFAGLARQYARHKKLDHNFGLEIPGPTTEALERE